MVHEYVRKEINKGQTSMSKFNIPSEHFYPKPVYNVMKKSNKASKLKTFSTKIMCTRCLTVIYVI